MPNANHGDSPRLVAEDLLRIKVIDDVALSPDGRLVAATVRTGDRDANRYRSQITIFPVDGSPSWPLTAGTGKDVSPSWSPDGTRVAFLSDRGGTTQVWVIGLRGEARQLTTFPLDVTERPVWSPDGRRLAVVALEDLAPASAASPEQEIVTLTRLCYRTDGQGYLGQRYHHIWVVDVETGEATPVTGGTTEDYAPAWSPDGKSLAFVSNRVDERYVELRSALWVASAGGGPARRLTPEVGVALAPAWSPDGTHLAYVGIPPGLPSSVNLRVMLIPASGEGQPRSLTAGFDGSVCTGLYSDVWATAKTSLQLFWAPDGAAIRFVAVERGRMQVHEARLSGGTRLLIGGERACAMLSSSGDGRRLAFAAADLLRPADLYVAGGDGAGERRLSTLNSWLDEMDLARPISMRVTTEDGREIDAWLVPPAGVTEPVPGPLILHVHGGPHSIFGYTFFFDTHLLSGQGYTVLFANPRATRSYGDDFAICNIGQWGEGDTPDQLAVLDAATATGWVDPQRVGVMGLSYGGFMVNWLIGHTDRFRAAVSENGVSNLLSAYGTSDIGWYFMPEEMGAEPTEDPARYSRLSPISSVDRMHTPLLLLNGLDDWRCPIEQAEQLYTALKRRGRVVELVRFPGESHVMLSGGKPISRLARRQHLLRWFAAHL